jgi:4-azaleucine resistance transporter AzlC
MPEPAAPSARASFRTGVRMGVPYAIAIGIIAISLGVLARDVGFSALGAIAASAVIFAGSAQFAAVSILAAGGGVGAAIGAGALVNTRYLPMGAAIAPSLPGRPLKRFLQGQTIADVSWAIANRGDATFDRHILFGATAIQYLTWSGGTALGALGGNLLGDPDALGLDALFPAFFLALLLGELRSGRHRAAAALGAVIALVLVPAAPAGVPVLAAGVAAFIGLRRRAVA